MTADGHFKVPTPVNEPVRAYAPGDPQRKSLKARLAELTDARTEVPMQIGVTAMSWPLPSTPSARRRTSATRSTPLSRRGAPGPRPPTRSGPLCC